MSLLNVEIPMKLPSAGNLHEHWRARQKRIKTQRNAVKLAMYGRGGHGCGWLESVAILVRGEQLACTLTRVSPRKLDSDNLAFAFKGIRDQVAAELGVDDGSDAIDWRYAQERGPCAVRIEIARANRGETGVAP